MLHCNDIDGLMVDWLYGELESARATEVSGHVDGCVRCQAEHAAFSRTRELFSGLPETEPPSALTAMLVREAALSAKPAPAPAAESGGVAEWLSRLFRPLMHPMAAAVATLVLVVGVAGALYLSGDRDPFSESQKADSQVNRAQVDTPTAQPAGSVAPEPTIEATASRLEANSESPGQGADGVETEPLARSANILGEEGEAALRDERQKAAEIATPAKKPSTVASNERGDSLKKRVVADPAPAADLDSFASADDESKDGFAFRGQKAESWVVKKEAELERAFKADDCKTTASIANDIRDRSPSYYAANTADLEAVQKCKFYINNEAKRRTAVARKKADKTKSGGGKGAASDQELAAPADKTAEAE